MKSLNLPSFAASSAGIVHFFGTRTDPDRLASFVKVGHVVDGPLHYPRIASVKQVHGTDVVILDRPLRVGDTLAEHGDALVTNQPRLLIVVRTADCVPVLMADRTRKIIAAIHGGWRGLVEGIIPQTIAVLQQEFGSRSKDLQVAIGPSIGMCCYEVDQPVIERLRGNVPGWQSVLGSIEVGKARLNLKELIAGQALTCGVLDSAISRLDLCTRCQPDMFYSYRRDGTAKHAMLSGLMLT